MRLTEYIEGLRLDPVHAKLNSYYTFDGDQLLSEQPKTTLGSGKDQVLLEKVNKIVPDSERPGNFRGEAKMMTKPVFHEIGSVQFRNARQELENSV